MPRVTLYVPDDLKARMDEAGEAINWSAVAQRAFREAVALNSLRKEPTDMNEVVERLRASKERVQEADEETGKAAGAQWARETAEFDELKRVAELALRLEALGGERDLLQQTLGPERWAECWGGIGRKE